MNLTAAERALFQRIYQSKVLGRAIFFPAGQAAPREIASIRKTNQTVVTCVVFLCFILGSTRSQQT